MPALPSRSPSTEGRRRGFGFVAVAALIIAAAIVLAALPASIAAHFMPKNVRASDFSGTLWHGSAAQLSVNGYHAGAIEWTLHPLALLRGRIGCRVHWVKGAFLLDGTLVLGRSSVDAQSLQGGGPLADLGEVNPTPGWQGDVEVAIDRLTETDGRFEAAHGTVRLDRLSSPRLSGDPVGSYQLDFGDDAVQSDGSALAHVEDRGGVLEVQATVTIQPAQRLATLAGTLKERGAVPDTLRRNLDALAQMRGRDRDGRIPLDFEFAL